MNVNMDNIRRSCELLEVQKELRKAYLRSINPGMSDDESEHAFWSEVLESKDRANREALRKTD